MDNDGIRCTGVANSAFITALKVNTIQFNIPHSAFHGYCTWYLECGMRNVMKAELATPACTYNWTHFLQYSTTKYMYTCTRISTNVTRARPKTRATSGRRASPLHCTRPLPARCCSPAAPWRPGRGPPRPGSSLSEANRERTF